MASITIRRLDESTKTALRVRAARNGRSMEEEARVVLTSVVEPTKIEPGVEVGAVNSSWLREVISKLQEMGGVELELPPRVPSRPPPDFSGPEFG